MVLLITEKDVIEQWAVRRQEGAGDLEWLGMPILWLVGLLCDIKFPKASNLFFKLDDESNLSADAEVPYAKETDSLKEGKSV